MKKIVIFIVFSAYLFGLTTIKPSKSIDLGSGIRVEDMVLRDDNLVIGINKSKLLVYNLNQNKIIKEIKIPKIKDFMGDTIDAKVASVDFLDGKYLLLSDSGIGGYSNLRIYEDNKTINLFTAKDKKPLVKARFIDSNHILLGYLSDELELYDIKNKKSIYRVQLTESKFSDFALNENKSLVAVGCESGEVTVVDVKSGKVIKRLNSQNVDLVFKVDIKKDIVVAGGKDRRASWYNLKTSKASYFKASFFVYAVALSPSAEKAAFAMDENSDITIYNLGLNSKVAKLVGQKGAINTIIFKDEDTIFCASEDNIINIWKLK